MVDRLLSDARAGRSGVLVIRGEAGIGKSALLDHAARAAEGMTLVRSAGIESETHLSFAALHLLLRPALARVHRLPGPQAAAIQGAFGLAEPGRRDRLLIGLAVLTLLAELAGEGSLLCLVDDAQWLDAESAEALLFAARRLESEGIAVLIAARDEAPTSAAGFPELHLHRLRVEPAAALLDEWAPDLAPAVRDRIIGEAEGSPLALVEWARALTAEQRRGDAAPPSPRPAPLPLASRLHESFARQVCKLPRSTQAVLLLAAAEGTGSLEVVADAAGALGWTMEALLPAERVGLVVVEGGQLRFRHPLLRAAIYQGAEVDARLTVHRGLAAVLRPDVDAGRRAWHLAAAAPGPDEAAAAELERTAERSRDRGGDAAVADAYERAAELTADREARARRLVAAAEAAAEAGHLRRAGNLAAQAARLSEATALGVRVAGVRAVAEAALGSLAVAHSILLAGAERAGQANPAQAVSMLTRAALIGWSAGEPVLVRRAVDALGTLPATAKDRAGHLGPVLGATARLAAGDPAGGVEAFRDYVANVRRKVPEGFDERLAAGGIALYAGDDDAAVELWSGLAEACRTEGHVSRLAHVLPNLAVVQALMGRVAGARVSAAEGMRLAADTRSEFWIGFASRPLTWIAALEGDEERCRSLAEQGFRFAAVHDLALIETWTTWALALLDLGLGRPGAALERMEASMRPERRAQMAVVLSAPDQVEAAVRSGQLDRAGEPLARFEAWAAGADRPWAAAVAARCRALVSPDGAVEERYVEALRLHRQGGRPLERARTQLLYGEWLRRRRRRADARPHLRAAREAFELAAAAPWARRAAAELRAAGEGVQASRGPAALARLTPQEVQITRLAAEGRTNRDIAARLFLSPRTVGYHLSNAFPKLGVASRSELIRLATQLEWRD